MKKIISLFIIALMFTNFSLPAVSKTVKESNNFLQITRSSKHLHSRLSKDYRGYVYKIKNISDTPVIIENINLRDHATEQIAVLSTKRTAMDAAKNTIETGARYALPSLSLSFFGSIIVAPFMMIGNAAGNEGLKQEAAQFDKQPHLPGKLAPNRTTVIKTMALKPHTPIIRVAYKNPISEETMYLDLK